MPIRIKILKDKARDMAGMSGHVLSNFRHIEGTSVHIAECKDCGATMEIDESQYVDSIYSGTTLSTACGEPRQPEVPGECPEPMYVFGKQTEEFEAVMPPANPETEPEKATVRKVFKAMADAELTALTVTATQEGEIKSGMIINAPDIPELDKQVIEICDKKPVVRPKPHGRVVRFPDGTEYETRSDGWRRVTSRRCEKDYKDVHNNSVRRRMA